MNICSNCSNKNICGVNNLSECAHHDVAFTRSEVVKMLDQADDKKRAIILTAVEKVYKIKMDY